VIAAGFLAATGGGAGADPGAGRAGAASPARSTVDSTIVPVGHGDGYRLLTRGPGEGYTVREEGLGRAKPRRAEHRRSLGYIAQLSDFQLADEESPARVEQVDPLGPPVDAAWRPWEAMEAQIDDAMIRRVNAFADAGPVRAAHGRTVPMDFAIDTGDSADNQQLNETRWVRTLLDGGRLDPNSGIDPTGYVHPLCPPAGVPGQAEADRYTGVQDYDDYDEGSQPYFYDPDDVRGTFAGFPSYPGLLDRAQHPFDAAGLDVPSYIAFGNHDGLVQGNQGANGGIEETATGCTKPFGTIGQASSLAGGLSKLTPRRVRAAAERRAPVAGLVPPDPARRFVSKSQYMDVFRNGKQRDGHGFGFIDEDVAQASGGSAGYYSFEPVPHLRMIALDTLSEGGIVGPSADGNVDDPQFRWLERELKQAKAHRERVILFSHHAVQSLTANVPDEVAPPCIGPDSHGHDANPGCDVDPRSSTPIHLGDDLVDLLHRYPNVIAWVAGHSHVNDIQPYKDKRSGFWMIRTAAEADWPQQARLIQLFDNRDGTLSIFGTIIDHASPVSAPKPGTSAAGMSAAQLASIGRNLAYNDNQVGARECDPACGEGRAKDRNVELLIRDPLRPCTRKVKGSDGKDDLRGTDASERFLARAGADSIRGGGGRDCAIGGRGPDHLRGGNAPDRLRGQGGADVIDARDGGRDKVDCGRGTADLAIVDREDRVRRCERVRVP
jgi:metallophosphoesterase (TIGR03767 family)